MVKFLMVGTFMALLLASGFYAMRKTNTVGDFFLGGREIGPWFSAFAYGTTYFSAVIFIGYAGKIGWGFGMAAMWVGICNAIFGSYLAWKLLAKPTREMSEKLGVMTMPEFLQARYDSHGLKIFSALIIFIFLVPYSASVYMGLSYVFEVLFQLPYNYILVFMALITAAILWMGGYRALALTDFIQGLVMLLGVGLLIYYIFNHSNVGGFGQVIPRLREVSASLTTPFPRGQQGMALFSLVFLTSIGPWGLPQMIQKFFAIKDATKIKAATTVATFFSLIVGLGAYGMGSVSRLYFRELPIDPATGQGTVDMLVPKMMETALPEIVAVLILLLILSASISTLSSLVLISSSSVTIDLLKGYIKPDMGKGQELSTIRSICLVFIFLSVLLALAKPAVILTLMALSWGTVAGVFLGPYLWGLFGPRTTKTGAWCGAVGGLITSMVFAWLNNFDSSFVPMGGTLAMLVSLGIVPIVSSFTKGFSREHLQKIFAVNYID